MRTLAVVVLVSLAAWPCRAGEGGLETRLADALPWSQIDRAWQAKVVDADFIGVVECVQAGETAAKYVVIESWKGPPEGTEFVVREAAPARRVPEPSLVGERFVVSALKESAPFVPDVRVESDPLDWRAVPADYRLELKANLENSLDPLLLPYWRFGDAFGLLGTGAHEWYPFKKLVKDFLALNPAQQELQILRAEAARELMGGEEPSPETVAATFPKTRTVETLLSRLSEDRRLLEAVALRGREGTLEWFSTNVDVKLSAEARERILATIAQRLAKTPPEPPKPAPSPPAEAPSEVVFAPKRGIPNPVRMVELLTKRDGAKAARYLRRWKAPRKGSPLGYQLVSYFGHECREDCAKQLRKLLRAKEPLIQAGAAVYLNFYDPAAGERALRRCLNLPGDAGFWAALALARRGDKKAVDRLLAAFGSTTPDGYWELQLHTLLEHRTMIMLSNSADAAGTLLPPKKDIGTWWAKYSTRLTLVDPLSVELSRQRVD